MALDTNQLFDLVKSGKNASEIIKALGIPSKLKLCEALYNLSVEKREILTVPGLEAKNPNDRKFNKSGLALPPSLLKDDFSEGDIFRVEKAEGKITLTLVTKSGTDQD